MKMQMNIETLEIIKNATDPNYGRPVVVIVAEHDYRCFGKPVHIDNSMPPKQIRFGEITIELSDTGNVFHTLDTLVHHRGHQWQPCHMDEEQMPKLPPLIQQLGRGLRLKQGDKS